MATVFKNISILNESPGDEDRLGFSEEIKRVADRIQSKIKLKQSVIIAYLGAFGIGKSTILENIKSRALKKYKWITFEAWRYSNRDKLWDSFVIKVISEISGKKESTIARDIDGKKVHWRLVIGISVGSFLLLSLISYYLYINFHNDGGFSEAYLKYAAATVLPVSIFAGLGVMASVLTYSDPLKRTFQLEDRLRNSIKEFNQPIILVLEDIDRVGEDGAIFMETLHEFVSKNKDELANPVIFIAPQSLASFDALATKQDRVVRLEHSLKVYDEKIYFGAKIEHEHVDNLFESLPFTEKYKKYRRTMTEITKELNYYYKADQLTIRMLKHALREVDWFIEANPEHNPSVALVYSLACILRHVPTMGGPATLAIGSLRGHASLGRNREGAHHIDTNSALLACLGIAAGAEGTGVLSGFIDDGGKYTHSAAIKTVKIFNNKDGQSILTDEVVTNGDVLEVYLRDTYRKQFAV